METLAHDMAHSLPNIPFTLNMPACINLSWHIFDISTNHILNKINWQDGVINLQDDKLLICFAVTYYNEIGLITPTNKIREQPYAGGIINIQVIRDYFIETGFTELFAQDPEITDMCNLKATDFIVMPIYEARNHIYMGLYNINHAYGQYLQSIYPAKQNKVTAFYNLFELADGLQNHTSITGIQHATSFNLFRALFKLTGTQSSSLSRKPKTTYYYDSSGPLVGNPASKSDNSGAGLEFNITPTVDTGILSQCPGTGVPRNSRSPNPFGNRDVFNTSLEGGLEFNITPTLEIPIMVLYNAHNYFPQFQVVWTTNKMITALPGVPAPTSTTLLKKNKLLTRFHEKHNTTTDTPRIPRVMQKHYEANKDKLRLSWLAKYNKFCASSSDPESHYTNLDKLITQMRNIKLKLTNLDA